MAFQVLSMWQALDEHQVKFVPMLIGPLVSMTLVPQSGETLLTFLLT